LGTRSGRRARRSVGAAGRASLGDVAKGIGTGVAELRGIRGGADAEGIQDQDDGAPGHGA
jgi:hypothetical protein